MPTKAGQDIILSFANQEAFILWLDQEHKSCPALGLRIFKAKSGTPSITYQQALEAALCYGWIDGIKKSFDEISWIQRFTPRRPKSLWSARNTKIVEDLLAQNKITEAGLVEIERAKQDGRWDNAYSGQGDMEIPEDLMAKIRADLVLEANFKKLKKADLYSIYFKLTNSKRPETRNKWVEHIIAKLKTGAKIF